jgi:hypothetical protein
MKATVEHLFSIPLFRAERSEPLSADELRAIQSLSYVSNVGNSTTIQNYVLDEVPELHRIGEFCREALARFMHDVVGTDDKLNITISWG